MVLDLGINVQGPQAAGLLSDLGADVIKVELPGVGDQGRWVVLSPEDRRAPYFEACNRGKRSLTLDVRRDEGREVLMRLAERADVIISNFKVGTMDEWGLGYEDVAARNPRIVYGTGSVVGTEGPQAAREGADLTGQAEGGLIASNGCDGDRLSPVGAVVADHCAAQSMCIGILAALLDRERTGVGQRVDVSLVGSQVFAQAGEYTAHFMTGLDTRRANGGHPSLHAIYGVFATSDGHIAIVGVPPAKRRGFWSAVGLPHLADDERFASMMLSARAKEEAFEILEAAFAERTTAEWRDVLARHGQRFAVVRTHAEAATDEHLWLNGYLRRTSAGEAFVGSPIRLGRTDVVIDPHVPELGEHTELVLLEAGFSWDEIAGLRDMGVT